MPAVSRTKWTSGVTVTSAVAMALVPKCPACVAVYFGFLSAYGIDRWAPDYLWPLTYLLFGASVAFLGYRAWRLASYAPFVVALAGASTLALARAADASAIVVWTGCALFLVGAFWSARGTPKEGSAHCHSPEPVEGAAS
jgi:hypothetical protein